MDKINRDYKFLQVAQFALLTVQGVILISSGVNKFEVFIWIGLLVLAIWQVALVLRMPKRVDVKDLQMDRGSVVMMRSISVFPFLIIVLALLMIGE